MSTRPRQSREQQGALDTLSSPASSRSRNVLTKPKKRVKDSSSTSSGESSMSPEKHHSFFGSFARSLMHSSPGKSPPSTPPAVRTRSAFHRENQSPTPSSRIPMRDPVRGTPRQPIMLDDPTWSPHANSERVDSRIPVRPTRSPSRPRSVYIQSNEPPSPARTPRPSDGRPKSMYQYTEARQESPDYLPPNFNPIRQSAIPFATPIPSRPAVLSVQGATYYNQSNTTPTRPVRRERTNTHSPEDMRPRPDPSPADSDTKPYRMSKAPPTRLASGRSSRAQTVGGKDSYNRPATWPPTGTSELGTYLSETNPRASPDGELLMHVSPHMAPPDLYTGPSPPSSDNDGLWDELELMLAAKSVRQLEDTAPAFNPYRNDDVVTKTRISRASSIFTLSECVMDGRLLDRDEEVEPVVYNIPAHYPTIHDLPAHIQALFKRPPPRHRDSSSSDDTASLRPPLHHDVSQVLHAFRDRSDDNGEGDFDFRRDYPRSESDAESIAPEPSPIRPESPSFQFLSTADLLRLRRLSAQR
ncbi:hypothetical protein PLICRDRAFT_37690 [Plicaturopsis crispa FD-325 SS-3]|nr:hypothetical protein PLICRDRAFT_37690 [Plicaturopsis crispa FD-325 SS-3]